MKMSSRSDEPGQADMYTLQLIYALNIVHLLLIETKKQT